MPAGTNQLLSRQSGGTQEPIKIEAWTGILPHLALSLLRDGEVTEEREGRHAMVYGIEVNMC